jgi:hypothetical protein
MVTGSGIAWLMGHGCCTSQLCHQLGEMPPWAMFIWAALSLNMLLTP